MRRWLLAGIVVAMAIPLLAAATAGAQSTDTATQTTPHTTNIEIRLWQETGASSELALSIRLEGGRWDDLGTASLDLGRRSDSRRYRYGDIALAGIEIRVWRPVAGQAGHFISARREGGLWSDLDTVPVELSRTSESGRYRYGNVALELPSPGSDRALLVSAGGEHTCALRGSGEVVCWGDNVHGQTEVPEGRYRSLSAGEWHTCALRDSADLVCWGRNFSGQTDAPSGKFRSVSVGFAHACAVHRSGRAVCWGANGNGQGDAPSGSFHSLSAGEAHTCGVRETGLVECWGDNELGQSAPPSGRFQSVLSGSEHSCGMRDSGALVCWGARRDSSSTPLLSADAGDDFTCAVTGSGAVRCRGSLDQTLAGSYRSVSAGSSHACAVDESGAVECWANRLDASAAEAPSGTFASVSAGHLHTCALGQSGEVTCWGTDSSGRTDAPSGTFRSLSAGSWHTCAVRTSGQMVCWGENIGGGADAPSGSFRAVRVGVGHTCAAGASGDLACWGLNQFGQANPPSGRFRALSAGDVHTCAVRTSGAMVCWGGNWRGQLDAPAGSYRSVSVGGGFACALRQSGELACWGANDYGKASPPAGSYRSVSAGWHHACAVADSGEVSCWGQNTHGQTAAPTGDFRSVSAGALHTCALRASGEAVCWGHQLHAKARPPESLRVPTLLQYDRLDPMGEASTEGSYAFLEKAGDLASAIGNFGAWAGRAAELRIYPTDATGRTRAAFYDRVAVGDSLDYRTGPECAFRFRVTRVGSTTTPRVFGLEPVYGYGGRCGSFVDDPTAARDVEFVWHPGPGYEGPDGVRVFIPGEPAGPGTYWFGLDLPCVVDVPAGEQVIFDGFNILEPDESNVRAVVPLIDARTGSVLSIEPLLCREITRTVISPGDRDVDGLFDQIAASLRLVP